MEKPVKGPDGRSTRWQAHREARRLELVRAAVRAVDRLGPHAGMEDIAAEAGVTKPVLYRHFADKSELHREVGRWIGDLVLARTVPHATEAGDPDLRIRRAVDGYLSVLAEHPRAYHFAQAEAVGGPNPVTDDRDRIAAAVTTLLGDLMRGVNRDSGGAEPWAYGIVGMVQSTGEWWLQRQSMSRAAVTDYLSNLIWHALAGVLGEADAAHPPLRLVADATRTEETSADTEHRRTL